MMIKYKWSVEVQSATTLLIEYQTGNPQYAVIENTIIQKCAFSPAEINCDQQK